MTAPAASPRRFPPLMNGLQASWQVAIVNQAVASGVELVTMRAAGKIRRPANRPNALYCHLVRMDGPRRGMAWTLVGMGKARRIVRAEQYMSGA